MIDERKLEHIEVCLNESVEAEVTTGFEDVRLQHEAVPEVDRSDVELSTEFLGRRLDVPLVIAAMTGGHDSATEINRNLAEAAERVGVAIGVGSQRAAIEDPDLAYTYSVVSDAAPTAPKIANLGGPQLVTGYGSEEAREAVEMVDAAALAIHLNFTQEAVQPEGDTEAEGLLDRLSEICDALDVPVVAKETGAGVSRETAERLVDAGVAAIDVSGLGGTSWSAVELHRADGQGDDESADHGRTFREWGIPTAQSVAECAGVEAGLMASGGVRSGLDTAKAVALGADVAGAALPFLAPATKDADAVEKRLKVWGEELRTALFLTGSRTIDEMKRTPLTITGKTAKTLEQRGVSPETYARR